jgi:hypothetical protein
MMADAESALHPSKERLNAVYCMLMDGYAYLPILDIA